VKFIAQAFHIRKFIVALNPVERTAAFALPCIVDVDVGPAMIDEAGVDHAAGAFKNLLGVHSAAPAIPTVPTHWRSESDSFATDDAKFLLAAACGIFSAERDGVFACFLYCTGDLAGLGIEVQAGGH